MSSENKIRKDTDEEGKKRSVNVEMSKYRGQDKKEIPTA